MAVNFCVIYRWKLTAGQEQAFGEAWEIMTRQLREHAGALGSRLHRSNDGTWLAYAQWPSRETWESAAVETDEAARAMATMSAAIERRFDPEFLEPVADLLIANDAGN